jgi:hypothetical protein
MGLGRIVVLNHDDNRVDYLVGRIEVIGRYDRRRSEDSQ